MIRSRNDYQAVLCGQGFHQRFHLRDLPILVVRPVDK
jgi:hypothetical protein